MGKGIIVGIIDILFVSRKQGYSTDLFPLVFPSSHLPPKGKGGGVSIQLAKKVIVCHYFFNVFFGKSAYCLLKRWSEFIMVLTQGREERSLL
jgi:hypothetical protein